MGPAAERRQRHRYDRAHTKQRLLGYGNVSLFVRHARHSRLRG